MNMRDNGILHQINSGDSVEVDVNWKDMQGTASIPSTVEYRVFDERTGAAVSPLTTVSGPAASMTIPIPASHLPANTEEMRLLAIQVRATFPVGDADTQKQLLGVYKIHAFA